jgi:hypothetical protein
MFALANAVFLCGAVLSMSGAAIAQTQERSGNSPISPLEVAKHFSRGSLDSSQPDSQAITRETADALAGNFEQPVMTPTRSSFLAKWQVVKGAGIPTTGINHWVYLPDGRMFVGVELRNPQKFPTPDPLEPLEFELQK